MLIRCYKTQIESIKIPTGIKNTSKLHCCPYFSFSFFIFSFLHKKMFWAMLMSPTKHTKYNTMTQKLLYPKKYYNNNNINYNLKKKTDNPNGY